MKKLFTLLVLLAATIGAKAQLNGKWENTHTTGYKSRTIINAKLQIKNSSGEVVTNVYQGNYTIAAFVGEAGKEECRLVTLDNADGVLFQPDASDASSKILTLAVPGNYTSDEDNGKPITFMIKVNSYIYKLNASQTITFKDEGTAYGYPPSTNPVILSMQMISHITIAAFNVGVGESINLREQLDVAPSGASIPMNAFKISDQYSEYATLNGDVLSGVKPVNNAILYLVNNMTGGNIESIYFNVIQHATSIQLLKTSLTVGLNDDETLTKFMTDNVNTYKLLPEGSNDRVRWEITDLNGQADYNSITYYDTHEFPWKPTEAGTVRIRPYVLVNNNKLVPDNNAWVTVKIVKPVTNAYLNWDADVVNIICNVGDELYQRIQNRFVVEPKDAAQTFKVELVNASDKQYLQIDNNSVVAKAPTTGDLYVWIVPTGYNGESKKFKVKVTIYNNATNVSAVKNQLNFSTTTPKTDIAEGILDNVIYTPKGSIPNISLYTINQWGSGQIVGSVNDDAIDRGFVINEDIVESTHTINATLTYPDYTNFYGMASQITYSEITISFAVVISTGLVRFDIDWMPYDGKTYGKIRLTPVPSEANYNISDFTKTFTTPQAYTELGWTGLNTISWQGLDCYIEASLPGLYTFSVTKNGVSYGSKEIDIPAHISYNFGGWKWSAIPYGDLAGNKVKNFFNSRVEEARTYDNLLINDPSWGFYGSLLNSGINKKQMYKVHVGQYANDFFFYLEDAASVDGENVWKLQPGWNWMGSPYFYDRLFRNAIKSQSSLVAGMVIVSKADGQKEYNGTAWQGDLNLLKAEEGYLVYNPTNVVKTITLPTETTMTQGDETSAGARNRASMTRVWEYDHTQFANNMTMVVKMPELQDAENYTIGAFVDGECRGEGVFIDGIGFVTVHCNNGEMVTFQLHNELTGEYYDIDQTVKSRIRVGSLEDPFKLTSTQNTSTGIGTVNSIVGTSQHYDLNGRLLNSQRKGVSIQRKADGTVRKVVVSK